MEKPPVVGQLLFKSLGFRVESFILTTFAEDKNYIRDGDFFPQLETLAKFLVALTPTNGF